MRSLTLCFFLVLISLTAQSYACLNDRDTVVVEDKGLQENIRVFTGKFERNPPEYYEIRIKRLLVSLKANPNQIDAYDDIAVAYDRIGNDDAGLVWIEKKRTFLPAHNAQDDTIKEQWYRYYANIGTIRVHRWLRSGANKSKLNEVEQAKNEIGQALAIKPLAHYGREKNQYQVMQWIIENYGKANPVPLDRFLKGETDEVVTGLRGLVVLGNAWESVDIFQALSALLANEHKDKAAYMAYLRACEIERMGRHSLINSKTEDKVQLEPSEKDNVKDTFNELRRISDKYINARSEYMIELFNKGKHPDTDPTFWIGYVKDDDSVYDSAAKSFEFRERPHISSDITVFAFVTLLIIIVACVVIIVKRRASV